MDGGSLVSGKFGNALKMSPNSDMNIDVKQFGRLSVIAYSFSLSGCYFGVRGSSNFMIIPEL